MAGRRWIAVVAGFALSFSALGTVTAAPPGAEERLQTGRVTRLTLVVADDEVPYGAAVALSGRLTSGGKGLARQKVVIKHRPNGSRTWSTVGTVRTRRTGAWRKAVTVRLSGEYVAVLRGNRTLRASRSPARTVDTFAFVTDYAVAPGNRDAYRDEPWTFTARTAPELAGQQVRLVRGPFRVSTTVATATIGPGGAISLTHRMADVGQHEYWLSVDGGRLMYGADSPRTMIRTRAEGAPTPPSVTTATLPSVEVHVPYQATLLATGGEVTWSVVGGLPRGLTLDPATGTVTGAPASAGAYVVTVRATNVAGSATRSVTMDVTPGTLTVTTWPLDDAAVGASYPAGSFTSRGEQPMTCSPCADGYASWEVTAGSLPPGLLLEYDEFLEEAYVYGTPTQAGLYHFTATAVADQHSGSREFTLRVLPTPADLLRIDYDRLTEAIADGVEGEPYSYQFTAGGATGLTWTMLSDLPDGLALSPGGLLSGTPTQSGHGWIYVSVTDGTRYDWQGFAMLVRPAP